MRTFIFTFCYLSFISLSLADKDAKQIQIIEDKYQSLSEKIKCPQITAKELKKLSPERYILIDVRNPDEQKISTLPQAIDENTFFKNLHKYRDKLKIVYCTIGYRSGLFAEKHKKLKILNLAGGVLAWSHIHGTFMNEGKITLKVHTYSKKWNFLNKSYQAIYD
ncbi:MAG: rhodanese-like domain-containing protein [Lentisphaerales bacterium]|nr:rhodanese-like domain-containing protein [Lentisphaerales bacterium]